MRVCKNGNANNTESFLHASISAKKKEEERISPPGESAYNRVSFRIAHFLLFAEMCISDVHFNHVEL